MASKVRGQVENYEFDTKEERKRNIVFLTRGRVHANINCVREERALRVDFTLS